MSNDQLIEDASLLDGFAAEIDGRPVGCALVNEVDGDAELVALVSTYRGAGVGISDCSKPSSNGKARGLEAPVARHEQRQHRAIRMYSRVDRTRASI